MRTLLSLFLALFCFSVFAQQYTISGRVKDASNGETLIGATIIVKGGGGAISNEYGFYSLSLEKGTYEISYQYLGYKDIVQTINLNENKTINIDLVPASTAMEAAIVTAKSSEKKVENKKD